MATGSDGVRQAGVVATKDGLVCLVTSSSGKRWVIPKGCLEPGKSPGEIALQEAWEEAGLVGVLRREPLGSFVYEKFASRHHVLVYAMQVTGATESWPEAHLRQRVWLTAEHALARLDDPGLCDIIRNVLLDERVAVG